MRISSDKNDPGYELHTKVRHRNKIAIHVNGVEERYCVTADTKRRIAVVADLAAPDRLQVSACGRKVKHKQLRGTVEIVFAPRADTWAAK